MEITLNIPDNPTSLEEFERDMDALAEGLDHLPALPRDFSRADIYEDYN